VPGGLSHQLEGLPNCFGRGSGGALVKVVLLEEAEVVGSRLPGNVHHQQRPREWLPRGF
jgi:hypothetical protein